MGVDSSYFQRLTLCETLSRTLEVAKTDLSIFFRLGLVTVGIYALVWAGLQTVLMPALDLDANRFDDPEYLTQNNRVAHFYLFLFLHTVVSFVITAIGNGALIRAVADIYLRQQPSFKECIRVGVKHSVAIIVSSFLGYIGVLLGLMCFVLPGYYLMVKWFLVNPCIIVEGLGAIAALKRSSNLVSGSWCYVFGTYLIAFMMILVLQMVWNGIFSPNVFTFFGSILSSIPSLVFGPIVAILMTIMYINLRIEKEGLNAETFARNLGDQSATTVASYSSLIQQDEADIVVGATLSNSSSKEEEQEPQVSGVV